MVTDDTRSVAKPVPIRGEVVPARVTYEVDVRERCYELWSTRCARNYRAVERVYASQLDPNTPTPTYETIRRWANQEGWEQRRRDDYERGHGETLYDLQLDTLAIMRRHVDVMADAQSGAYDDNPAAGLVRLKPGEMAGKIIERGVLPLMPKPRELPADTSDMPRDEREQKARQGIVRTKGTA